MIIGITGTKSSGKDLVAGMFREAGFVFSSISDRCREEAIVREKPDYTIKNLQDIGNDLREKFGTGILVEKSLDKLKGQKNIALGGIRNPGEVFAIKERGGVLIAVDSPEEIRYKRLISRNKREDPKEIQQILEMDKRDLGEHEAEKGQQVRKSMELADYRLYNNGTLDELQIKVEELLKKILV